MMAIDETAFGDIKRLQMLIEEVLTPLIDGFDSYVLFDVPVHNNVGDSAMLLGELAFLRRHFRDASAYLCRGDRCDYQRIASRYKSSLIFIQGGGNFGDVWPEHQKYRETLLERFPGRPIIQFPQTIQYTSKSALSRTQEIIKRHGKFTLLVRDAKSFDLAKSAFECSVLLCPDMAFALDPIRRIGNSAVDLLLLMRQDHEADARFNKLTLNVTSSAKVDWPIDARPVRALRQILALLQALVSSPISSLKPDELNNRFVERLAQNRLNIGVKLLSSGRIVITDRLHASILSLLLGIPCSAIDNNYGKVSGFLSLWLPRAIPLFDTFDDAISATGM